MCVIAYKAKGVRFPSKERIEDMWETNPDGAGVMWRDNVTNKIKFVKGFMHLKQLNKWIDKNLKWLEEVECALHFRITTHGGTSKGNCHPFVCDCNVDPHLLAGEADFVMMHNGVLPIKPRTADISDSAELALRIGDYEDPMLCLDLMDELLHGNRVICMGKDGTMMYGDAFVDCCHDGIMYSNDHFLHHFPSYGYTGYSKWLDNYYLRMRPAAVNEGSTVKIGDVIDSALSDTKIEAANDDENYGWWWDKKFCVWRDAFGSEVTIDCVDPDFLSAEDYDEYYSQTEGGRDEMDKLIEEAEYYGMNIEDYMEWVNKGK